MGDITGIKTAGGYELQNVMNWGGSVVADPDPRVCYYQHFDLSTEQLGRTGRYNCWGFTFLPRRYWINSSHDVDMILADNCTPQADGTLRRGDVIRYRDDAGVTTHTGRVWQVDGAGHCLKVRSKWGGWAEYIHNPPDVPASYGTHLAYFRQHAPLQGIADLFVHDAGDDLGEQFSPNQWVSPDIVVDAPPYGSVDVNPVFGQVNRVWAVVHNRCDQPIANACVRYYWANPYVGFASANWQLIPGTPGHPNPSNAFAIAGGSAVQAPYVEWIPHPVAGVSDPAHQCLLAVAYVDDDPKDSANPDPLVYPFDIAFDNNIAARNVHILTLAPGKNSSLTVFVGLPWEKAREALATLSVRLTHVPRLAVLGYSREIVPPQIAIALDGEHRISLPGLGKAVNPFEVPQTAGAPLPKQERLLAATEITKLSLVAGKPRQLHVQVAVPPNATPGSNYYLRIEQEIDGAVTGGYVVAITVTK